MSDNDPAHASNEVDDNCVIPTPISAAVGGSFLPGNVPHAEKEIRRYVEVESGGQNVEYVELVKTEFVFGQRHDIWDVHTSEDRYWVITNLTNLYSQKHFPSLDFAFTLHLGVLVRMQSRASTPADEVEGDALAVAWRRWKQAAEALDEAEEAEEFQAVGMRCRECLLALIRAITTPEMVPEGKDTPKRGDFIHWTEIIADSISPGKSAAEIRGYLKSSSRSTWQLANWLTHASNASRYDAELTIAATENVLGAFGMTLLRRTRGSPESCPACSSYRLTSVYESELRLSRSVCESCGWTDLAERMAEADTSTPASS
jgi:hypothetical protein